jgi:delta 1-pyrroline-5-carboxylate dehydrogenase
VGNLYFNRKCTGAMVGAHPFGGFNMSGTDSKAGGPDYLLLFLQAKSVATKVVNCGADPLVRAGRPRPALASKNQASAIIEEPARGPAADEGVRPTK